MPALLTEIEASYIAIAVSGMIWRVVSATRAARNHALRLRSAGLFAGAFQSRTAGCL